MKNDHFERSIIARMCMLKRGLMAATKLGDMNDALMFSAKFDGFMDALGMTLSPSYVANLTRRANEQLANEETNRTTRKEDT